MIAGSILWTHGAPASSSTRHDASTDAPPERRSGDRKGGPAGGGFAPAPDHATFVLYPHTGAAELSHELVNQTGLPPAFRPSGCHLGTGTAHVTSHSRPRRLPDGHPSPRARIAVASAPLAACLPTLYARGCDQGPPRSRPSARADRLDTALDLIMARILLIRGRHRNNRGDHSSKQILRKPLLPSYRAA